MIGRNAHCQNVISPDRSPAGIPFLYVNGIGQHVNHGVFWIPGSPLKNAMTWECWAMRDGAWDPTGYIVSDGYGGSHALLWSGTSGNITFADGVNLTLPLTYTSDDIPPRDVFSHFAVSIVRDVYGFYWIQTYINGICVGRTLVNSQGAQTYPVTRVGAGGGSGILFIGGSDHSNFIGWIAQLRGWDAVVPSHIGDRAAFIPQRHFAAIDNAGNAVDFLANYMKPTVGIYDDLSSGYDANGAIYKTANVIGGTGTVNVPWRLRHPGRAFSIADSPYQSPEVGLKNDPPPVYPMPRVDYLINTPFDQGYDENNPSLLTAIIRGYAPKAPPVGAKLYDSFSRADQTFAHTRRPSMGSIEYSAIGPVQAWQTAFPIGAVQTFLSVSGIFSRSAISLEPANVWRYVNNNSGDCTIEITRRPTLGSSADGETGLAFRIQDPNHGFCVRYSNPWPQANASIDLYRSDGTGALISVASVGGLSHSDTWSVLRVVLAGNSIKVYTVDAAVATLRLDVIDANYLNAPGVGLWQWGNTLARYYEWTVK